jgi:hypothetical protein
VTSSPSYWQKKEKNKKGKVKENPANPLSHVLLKYLKKKKVKKKPNTKPDRTSDVCRRKKTRVNFKLASK